MGQIRNFEAWWTSLPLSRREKMDLHDAEFVWMCQATNVKASYIQGRRAALKELERALLARDYDEEAELVQNFYINDCSYNGEYDD